MRGGALKSRSQVAAGMAESRRKLDSKKYQQDEEVDEAAERRRHMMWWVIFAIGAVAIIAGMFLIAHFLSGR